MSIEIIDFSKTIKGVPVLKNITLTLNPGIIYGLRGTNGSGKTMLLRAICGLIRPSSGEIIIDGEKLGEKISFPRSIGVLIENPSFLDQCTGLKNLQILASINGKLDDEKICSCLRSVGLNPTDKRKYKKYSLGMKQRLGIACAILEEPSILLLDEPTNALDEQGIYLLHEILLQEKKKGTTILLASHDKEEIEKLSDIIVYMESGKIKSIDPKINNDI